MSTILSSSLTTKELREPQIKAAVIDELFCAGGIDEDTVIISEMPVASLPRRADLVVANGSLLGFEIKSDGDKTARLAGQIEAYQKSFEGVVVVAAAKHLDVILASVPDTVGVFVIDDGEDGATTARMIRKPHIRKLDMDASIRQMSARDLHRLARQHGVASSSETDRFTLEQRVRLLPISTVRKASLTAIKQRYRKNFIEFKQAKVSEISTVEALQFLRRPSWKDMVSTKLAVEFSENVSDTQDVANLQLRVTKRRVS
ncbi:hypothetical protein ASF91_11005 [Rhizobium sp. Leaf155]|nr:hypothetical protein ASF91_11005 [Rhizobium sp. Leaf155]